MARNSQQIAERIAYYQNLADNSKRPRLQADAQKWVTYFQNELVLQRAYEARQEQRRVEGEKFDRDLAEINAKLGLNLIRLK